MGRGVVLVAALLSAALASACTPSDPPSQTPTPAPSPTFSCSTATVRDPCTAEKAQKEKEQAAAIADSKNAYKLFLAERNRLARAGGSASPTSVMKLYAGGPYLKIISGFLSQEKRDGQRYTSDLLIRQLDYDPGVARSDSPQGELAFKFCEDGRANKVVNSDGETVGTGALIAGYLYTRDADGWKVWDAKAEVVKQCTDGY